jgi:glycosyltransferase involved in cell wall biosynthesis
MDRQRRAWFFSYGPEMASFRHRLLPVAELLRGRGWQCSVASLKGQPHLRRFTARDRRIEEADVVVISKLRVGVPESWLVRRLARRIVFDCDDALWVRRPQRFGAEPRYSWWERSRFASTCEVADVVLAGSDTVAREAARWSPRVELVETPVDVGSYLGDAASERSGRTVVWIGAPSQLFYLELIRPILARLARGYSDLRLRVVCSRFPDWPEVPIERVVWSEDSEVEAMRTAGVGVMPLTDEEWSRGRGAFTLKQYMAASLPCVASPIGANSRVVQHGRTGVLAATPAEWEAGLRRLLASPETRAAMGRAGRIAAGRLFDRRVVAGRVADLLTELVESDDTAAAASPAVWAPAPAAVVGRQHRSGTGHAWPA